MRATGVGLELAASEKFPQLSQFDLRTVSWGQTPILGHKGVWPQGDLNTSGYL